MTDPYLRYGANSAYVPGGGSIPSFPGYLPCETSTLPSHPLWSFSHIPRSSSDFLHKDISTSRSGAYGGDDIPSFGVRLEPVIGGFSTETTSKGYSSPLHNPYLLGRRDSAICIGPDMSDIVSERPDSLRNIDDLPAASRESNVLLVDGLPNDCSRREVSHLFRPFIGFREIRVVHKELRRTGDKATVLCFVEFSDSKCALTALEALRGFVYFTSYRGGNTSNYRLPCIDCLFFKRSLSLYESPFW